MTINQFFINRFGRLRSGWRFAIFIGLFVFLITLSGAIYQTISLAVQIELADGWTRLPTEHIILGLLPALLAGWLCGKFLEGLPFRALGACFSKYWLRHLVLGILTGAMTIGIAVSIAVVLGGLSFEINPDQESIAIFTSLGVSFVIFAVAALFEEGLFRGYMLQTFSRAGIAWFAIVLTSVFFGFVHMRNPNAGAISAANTILAGVWFAIAYLKTRDLWFVWGMHLFWNWTQGAVFGIEVSGLTNITSAPLLKELDKGPPWLTGETYGIEGGIACTIAIIISTAAIYFLPVLKPSEEMLALTSREKLVGLPSNNP